MKTCECGAVIDPEYIFEFKANLLRCNQCGSFYSAVLICQYKGDQIGEHGELAHAYITLGNTCTNCGCTHAQNRQWHDLTHGESTEALETIIAESGLDRP
jgi:hypothetical protein